MVISTQRRILLWRWRKKSRRRGREFRVRLKTNIFLKKNLIRRKRLRSNTTQVIALLSN